MHNCRHVSVVKSCASAAVTNPFRVCLCVCVSSIQFCTEYISYYACVRHSKYVYVCVCVLETANIRTVYQKITCLYVYFI